VGKNLGFRGWLYFRVGWSTYFAFIFAMINTLVVTYYLAIENYPFLKEIFPSFEIYVIVLAGVGIPILVLTGYSHYRKTKAFRSEIDIWIENNPYQARWLVNSEMTLQLNLKLTQFIIRLSNGEKLSNEELKELIELQKKFSEHVSSRTIDDGKDKQMFPK
tara:strand:- start:1336 stop:1818 length:483 start_codon:yes stop_codon:yes gene_type:complete